VTMQKPEKRPYVRGDVQPLPPDVVSWFPPKVREASEQLETALERREESSVAHEIAESDARSAARARQTADDKAVSEGKPLPAASDAKAAERLTIARRTRDSADRVAAAAVESYLQALDAHDEEIGGILGARMSAENERARRALAEVESAIIKTTQLDRLGGTLRNPRWSGSQPMSRTAWEQPMPDAHAGLQACGELFSILGGRQEPVAA
jgi:hypothetical protein